MADFDQLQLVPVPESIQERNRHQWIHVAAFLAGLPLPADAAPGKRSAGAEAAGSQALPDGNHGDNRRSIK